MKLKIKIRQLFVLVVISSMLLMTACSNKETGTEQNTTLEDTATQSGNESSDGSTEASGTTTKTTVESLPINVDTITFEENDNYIVWKEEEVNYIELDGSSIKFSGSGAFVEENVIKISEAGTYVVSGTLEDGQIIVEEDNDGIVRLILNGVNINCSNSAPIYIKNAGKTIISLEEGTDNYLTDGTAYVYTEETEEEPNSTLFSKDDLTINGTGSLTIEANFNNAITSKDELRIMSGTYNITSVDDAIVGRDNLFIQDGTFTITAGGDGLKASNDTDATKGNVYIANGNFTVDAGTDGIQAETSLLITDGTYTIKTGGGSVNSSTKTEEGMGWGNWGGKPSSPETTQSTDSTDSTDSTNSTESTGEEEASSAKAIKANSDITINGGKFTIDSSDDSFHSNNSLTINNGEFEITSGDDGMHSDTILTINNGTFNIGKSYEGIESAAININNGDIHVTASDDGINVGGGADSSSMGGRPGQNSFSSTSNSKLVINGGYIYVDASGDGLDANGSIEITGGTVLVNGPTNDGNGSLDYDGTFNISGGTLASAGSSGMAMAPTEESTQSSISLTFTETQAANTIVQIVDKDGNTVLAFAPSKEFSNLVISTPNLVSGDTYTVYTGSKITGNQTDGLYEVQSFTAGETVTDITLENTVNYWGSSGNTMGGPGGGQGGGPGGFGGKGGFPGQNDPNSQNSESTENSESSNPQ